MSSACAGYDAHSRYECHKAGLVTVTAACEHEHIGPRWLCDWHLGDLEGGQMMCGDCQDSREPHQCVLKAVRPVAP